MHLTTEYIIQYNPNWIIIFGKGGKIYSFFRKKQIVFYGKSAGFRAKNRVFRFVCYPKNGLIKPKNAVLFWRWGKLSDDEIISGFVSELRRGTVVLGVLNQLSSPKYGYSLGQELTEKGVPVDGNTLYPLLRRLESQGLLKSEWDMSEGKPRKYYVRTAKGTKINEQLRDYWIETVVNISTLMKEE